MSNRLHNTTKNIMYNYINMVSQIALAFIARLVFVYTLDKAYLGVSGLFSNILGVLSFSELGIGAAIGFSLYKPLSENDTEKIKSLMALFKKAYCIIGFVVAGIGCALVPFLPYITKNETGISNITFYYFIFLFDASIGYFFSYRTTLLTCDQKAFKLTRINTAARYVITALQIFVLLALKSYVLYLVVDIVLRLFVQFYSIYLVKKLYPYLQDKNVKPIPKDELKGIWKNVRALMIHSLGYISITQTDNIIISSFLGLETVGVVSNYVMFTTYGANFVNTLMNSAVASIGNLIAKENSEVQLGVYKKFRFLSHWLNSWMAIGFAFLSTRMIVLMFGSDYALPTAAVLLMALSLLIRAELNPMMSFREAAGLFDKDKYLALCESIINLVVSIVAVQAIGIVGVYLGTVVSALFTVVMRWKVIYSNLFNKNSTQLFSGSLRFIIGTVIASAVCLFCADNLFAQNTWLTFIGQVAICVIVPNAVFMLMNYKTEEMQYYKALATGIIKNVFKKLNKSK